MLGMRATPLRAYDRRATMSAIEVAAGIGKAGGAEWKHRS
jgi:hypothetical protein